MIVRYAKFSYRCKKFDSLLGTRRSVLVKTNNELRVRATRTERRVPSTEKMPIQHRPTYAEINIDALRHNCREVLKRLPKEMNVLAIVKANAYGHGALFCARALAGLGVSRLGVATVEEGIELRDGGLGGEIFVLGGVLTPNPKDLLEYRLKPVLHDLEGVKKLGSYLKDANKEYAVHIKLDTGMGRLGLLPSDTEELIRLLKAFPQICVEGVMTHLARADEENPEPTDRQFVLFQKLQRIFEEKGLKAPFYHIANSAMIIDGRSNGYQWARPGIMLYGAYPHPRQREIVDLKPVMTLKTGIMSLKRHPAGSPLSYGGTFVTKHESLIGILPVGYADGYPRLVSNRASVLVRGRRAPVVGRVCMDLTLVDVTNIPGVSLGDEVVLFGKQGDAIIRAEEVADWAETISYEIFCGITSRVPRIYVGM